MPVPSGTVIDRRYKVIRLLGEGGYGAVYLSEDLRLGNKRVALKESFSQSTAAQEQFSLEAQLLADLNHSGLPRVSDHFIEKDGRQFLVMDYVEGEDLDRYQARLVRVLPEREAVALMLQVCEAVAYLHTRPQPVIHRDIKPANIKITPDGRAVLVDFGIAKLYSPDQRTAKFAKAITPHFSSPEQHTAVTDTRSDVYSLGATLYWLATGEVPPDAMDRLDGSRKLVPPRQLRSSLQPELEEILLRALELNPDRRFADAKELASSLKEFMQDSPVSFATIGGGAAAPAFLAPGSARVCPSCGFLNRPDARFCARDGTSLVESHEGQVDRAVSKPKNDQTLRELLKRANDLASSQEFEQAILEYEACLQQGLTDLALFFNLGLCYLEVGRFSDAATILEKGATRHPRDGGLQFQLARAFLGLNLRSESLEAAGRASQLAPEDAASLRLLGRLLFEAQQYMEALQPLQKALRLDPRSLSACILLGRAYGELQRLRPALNALRQAARIEPNSPEPYYWIGVFYYRSNRQRQAKEALLKALGVASGYEPARELLKKL